MKKTAYKITLLLTIFLSVFLVTNNALANYTSVSFSPPEGTIYGDSTNISINVNSGSEEYYGIDMFFTFTGPVEYMSGEGVRCSEFRVIETAATTLNVECLYIGDGSPYSGPVATLSFRALEEGLTTFTITSTDPDIDNIAAATYSLSTEATPQSGQAPQGENLPDAGIFGSFGPVIFGIALLVLGISLNRLLNGYFFFSHKVKEGSTKRRRNKLEKEF